MLQLSENASDKNQEHFMSKENGFRALKRNSVSSVVTSALEKTLFSWLLAVRVLQSR